MQTEKSIHVSPCLTNDDRVFALISQLKFSLSDQPDIYIDMHSGL